MAVYLGFDAGTQSLSAVAIEATDGGHRVLFERSLGFDEALPSYGTRHGLLPSADPRVAASPPLMWAEALDLMMGLVVTEGGFDPARVAAISGSAQQHGSVYLNSTAPSTLEALDPSRPLAGQIDGIFSRARSPVWMDSSTSAQCEAITRALGGDEAVVRLTGSRAVERFTGPQIRKLFEDDPEAYATTSRIHLVSSYLASLLAGREAPLEPGDASGMTLMDLDARGWSPDALEATAPGLAGKLPPIVRSWTITGRLSGYWTRRYGLPAARLVVWSGDNPSSLVGVGITGEDRAAISLGTSDTRFGLARRYRPDPAGHGHVFGAPTGDYMTLVCFKNGSLARERLRDRFGMDWRGFEAALAATTPGNRGAVMLPWFEPEITPAVLSPGARCYGLDPMDASAGVRALVEGQMLAMARHSAWMGAPPSVIVATGGASANTAILQVAADVHQAEVWRLASGNSACLGAALRARHADLLADGHPAEWNDIAGRIAATGTVSRMRPRRELAARYRALGEVHAACEAHALGLGPDPADRIAAWRQTFGSE